MLVLFTSKDTELKKVDPKDNYIVIWDEFMDITEDHRIQFIPLREHLQKIQVSHYDFEQLPFWNNSKVEAVDGNVIELTPMDHECWPIYMKLQEGSEVSELSDKELYQLFKLNCGRPEEIKKLDRTVVMTIIRDRLKFSYPLDKVPTKLVKKQVIPVEYERVFIEEPDSDEWREYKDWHTFITMKDELDEVLDKYFDEDTKKIVENNWVEGKTFIEIL